MLIADIARKAKVSPATVSRVINQPHLVAPDRLARVQAVMQAVSYTPTPLNRRRGPKSRLAAPKKIAVWFVGARRNTSHNWFQDQLLHVQPANERQRVELTVLFSDSPDDLPRPLAERQVDGVIVQGMEPSPACLQRLGDLPRVWFMTRRSMSYAGDYVEPDNTENGRAAADYLQTRGHKVVAVISPDPDYSAVAWRVRAFLDRAKEIGLTAHTILGRSKPNTSYLETAPMHEESESLARRVVQANPRPTGLYLPVDHFCGSFFRALRQAGVRSDRDVETLLGNYNPVIYHNLDHLPAALDINLPTLVRQVVDHLVWRIENPRTTGRIGVSVSPTLLTHPQASRLSA
ncbi:LacI family transcriptional regulator [Horticoccus luteus]|uniref:LacI family transcriptional regulator n=1 Tax=Horticoccus luteus TaxID=2862869 RepID=A0A8F9XLQ0_9BACT|nr:LacI family DNA-binding transcriptional regulator [Horticoccus luteus]QYM79254.1 LacI family transcriptional regulator [Horticoccus luteus]